MFFHFETRTSIEWNLPVEVKCKGLSPNFASNVKRINQLLFPLKLSENLWFSDNSRGVEVHYFA